VGCQERVVWHPSLSIPARGFDFTDAAIARVKTTIQIWDGYGANSDRRWLEPLLTFWLESEPRP
jgi:hypothetical protein